MIISSTTRGIVDEARPRQGLNDLQKAGFDNVALDLGAYCTGYVLKRKEKKLKPDLSRGDYERVKAELKNRGIVPTLVEMPKLDADTQREDLNPFMQRVGVDSVRACEELGCKLLVVHPLFVGIPREDIWKVNKEYYLQLAAECENEDTMLLLENESKDCNGRMVRGMCSDAAQAVERIDELNEACGMERFGFCMNVKNYMACRQNVSEEAPVLADHVKAVVLGDVELTGEKSLLPFTGIGKSGGETDWLGVIRGLRKIAFDGQLVMGFADTVANFPALLRPQVIALAKSVGEYLKWQIEMEEAMKKYNSIVLFGAGNMCRNFMLCYGEKYHPLFTCDNNSAVWGTNCEGLEVKSPEALKELPPDCGIFICNMYYREIEAQLREMGVENIEFYSDEYPPQNPFERIERG